VSEVAIQLQEVTKIFGKQTAVDRLDLVVPSGSIYGFIGPNGSGKTTTLRMILRIYQPDTGMVKVLGSAKGKTADDRLGYLPEERGLYKRMKVNDLLTYYARLKGCYSCQGKIDQWLDRLGAKDWGKKRIDSLSKGMAQKVQFISAVVAEPKLLILDEPFSGLDPINMQSLKDAVFHLREKGTTIVFSTHDMDMAERICDTIFMIFKGQKVLDGTLDEIKNQYASNRYRVGFDRPVDLAGLAGFSQIDQVGDYTDFTFAGADSASEVAQRLSAIGAMNHFQSQRPSLYDIFVRIAKPPEVIMTP